jgi:hypothetical protein
MFPDFAVIGDELALQFSDALRAFRASAAQADTAQSFALGQIDEYLSQLSAPKNTGFWHDRAALGSDERWQHVRDLARAALITFGWPDEPPSRDDATYVGADRVVRNKEPGAGQ